MEQRKYNNLPKDIDRSRVVRLEHGKLPPQAVDYEEAILGALMIDKKADEMFDVFVNPEVFYKESHSIIFVAIINLSEKNEPIDVLMVSQELKRMGKLEMAGGDYYLIQLTQKISSSAHIEYYSRIVLQKYMQREMIKLCASIQEVAYDETVDVFDMMDFADKGFTGISDMATVGKKLLTWDEMLQKVVKNVEQLTAHGAKILGTPTGFWKLDAHYGGWNATDFVVIGARPGAGKTAFTVASMLGAAQSGNAVGYMSLEMSSVQLATRSVAVNSNYHMNQLTRIGFDKGEYFEGLLEVVNSMRGLPIHIDDTPALNLMEIRRRVRRMHRRHGIKVLFLDYLQLAAGGDKDVRHKITELCYGLKALAKELDITVVGLSQLSRDVEKRNPPRPRLSDLAESGAIEASADIISFIYRPAYYGLEPDEKELKFDENTEWITAKFRNGGLGTIGLWYDDNRTKFMDEAPAYQQHNNDGNGNDDWAQRAQQRSAALPTPTANEAFGPVANSDDNDNGISF